MPRHPSIYADLLSKKIRENDAKCWLINTGWVAGGYGDSSRIKIKWTRALLNAALSGDLDDVVFVKDQRFGFSVPTTCEGVPDSILQPRQTWNDKKKFDKKNIDKKKVDKKKVDEKEVGEHKRGK